jgi:hypothetical protein
VIFAVIIMAISAMLSSNSVANDMVYSKKLIKVINNDY